MSSIYRKGRDGYYYYQTYVRDSNSGKKDKRIFHSLKTKNKEEAKKKQIDLDKKYYKEKHKSENIVFKLVKNNFRVILLIVMTSIITLFVDELINPPIKTKNKITKKNNLIQTPKGFALPKDTNIVGINKYNNDTTTIVENVKQSTNIVQKNNSIPRIPSYKIERLERLSGSFEQGKIFLTVDNDANSESLHLLCDKIMRDYSEFSNIVICLYTNDIAGKALAQGNDEIISVEERKRSWLAMYTYNIVEGEYFDDNPSDYLGNY